MNNAMKKYLIAFSVMMISGVAGVADSASRVDCTAIQARINELVAIEEPSAEQSTELAQLQAQYRADCSRSAAGRRATTTSRISVATVAAASTPVAATPQVETVVVTTRTVLDEYLNGRRELCDELKTDIDSLTKNGASTAELEPLQNQYDADCEEIDKSETVEVDEETAARNVASGLCEDGSKPNQFGCCEGETFTDMGNLVFACCPDDGGTCYPPINSGNAL